MTKVAVTGGAGFIGRWVCRALEAQGYEPLVVDHRSRPDAEYETMIADVRDSTAVYEAAAHADAVIHLAAVLGTQETIANPRPSAEINVIGALNVMQAATMYDLPVVYAGVGNSWMRDYAAGSYTISKTCAEDYTRMFNEYLGGRISVVRPMNAYGPGQQPAVPYGTSKVRKIIPAFLCRAMTGSPIEVYGDGLQTSDCIYVEDVAKVFVAAMTYTIEKGPLQEPAQVGPTESLTVNEIAHMAAWFAARWTKSDMVDVVHVPMRPGEVANSVVAADVGTLAPLEISARDFTTLQDGLEKTIAHLGEVWLPTYLARRENA